MSSTINLADTASITTAGNVFINQDNDNGVLIGTTTLGATVNVTAGKLYLNDTIEIDYNTDSRRFDTLNLIGALDLAGSTLQLDSTNYTPTTNNAVFTIINNDGTDAVTGTFTGLAEGAQVGTINGYDIFITYKGDANTPSLAQIGTGNDVQLYLNPFPVITSGQSFSLNENTKNTTVVGTVAATDGDNDPLSNWTITGGNTNNGFAINATTGVITVNDSAALDFETNPSFTLTLTVSDGTDTSLAQTVTINLNNLTEFPYTAGVDIANGTTGNDYADLLAGNDRFMAGAGDDMADGNEGDDLIYGGTGNDELYGGAGLDRLYGEIGNDVINGNAGQDNLYGGTGNDSIHGGLDNDKLYGEAGVDLLNGDEGNDILYGGTGNDSIHGGIGNDTRYGEAGNDILNGGAGNDNLFGGLGADTFVLGSGEGSDTIRDYQVKIDTISKGTLSVSLAQSGSNVLIKEGSDILATVLGVTTGQLSYLL